jgi:hypothetical protein
MGDRRRFDLFARLIATRIADRSARIADVAAGKGYLTFALREQGFRNVVPFEMHHRRKTGGKVRRIGLRIEEWRTDYAADFDAVVGMHPDQATDRIPAGCARHGRRGIVVPCCIRPSEWTYWGGQNDHRAWEDHLARESARRGLAVERSLLPMVGANRVIEVEPSPVGGGRK